MLFFLLSLFFLFHFLSFPFLSFVIPLLYIPLSFIVSFLPFIFFFFCHTFSLLSPPFVFLNKYVDVHIIELYRFTGSAEILFIYFFYILFNKIKIRNLRGSLIVPLAEPLSVLCGTFWKKMLPYYQIFETGTSVASKEPITKPRTFWRTPFYKNVASESRSGYER